MEEAENKLSKKDGPLNGRLCYSWALFYCDSEKCMDWLEKAGKKYLAKSDLVSHASIFFHKWEENPRFLKILTDLNDSSKNNNINEPNPTIQ